MKVVRQKDILDELRKPPRKKRSGRITKVRLLAAIEGSGGNVKVMAKRLKVTRATVYRRLKSMGELYPEIGEALEQAEETVNDLAELTVVSIMKQRVDFGEASKNARWWLERKGVKRGFGNKTNLELEGGANPIKFEMHDQVSLESLKLPLEVKLQILEAIEKQSAGEDQ